LHYRPQLAQQDSSEQFYSTMTSGNPKKGGVSPSNGLIMDMKQTKAKTLRAVVPLRIAGVVVNLFSCVGQRAAPSPNKKEHVRFISISVSNYVEKVRWVLDMLEGQQQSPIYFTEDFHAPAFLAFHTVPASKDQASQSPMIVYSDGRVVWGSDKILEFLCNNNDSLSNLYPKEIEEETKALEKDLGARLGASARAFAYYNMFDPSKKYYGVAAKFLPIHAPKVEQIVFAKMLDKGVDKAMIRAMNIDKCGEAAEQQVRKVFDEMSEQLEKNGGEYLMDTPNKKYGFTAADLTLSALTYFLIRPPEMAPFHLPESDLPPRFLHLANDLRETTAGKHILKVYNQHRPTDPSTHEVVLKKAKQDRLPLLEMAGAAAVVGGVALGFMKWTTH
jgi:glutathione S-transferase